MRKLLLFFLTATLLSLGFLLISGGGGILIPDNLTKDYSPLYTGEVSPVNNEQQPDTNISDIEENTTFSTPRKAEKSLIQPDMPTTETIEVKDVNQLYEQLLACYKQHKGNFVINIDQNIFNEQALASLVKKINKESSKTNYFISKYEFKTTSFNYSDLVKLHVTFEYKEVIDGFATPGDPSQIITISSYEEFDSLIKAKMQDTEEKVKYRFNNDNLDYSVNTLLKRVERIAETNRGNYVDKYGIKSFGTGGYVTIDYFYPANKVKEMKGLVNSKVQEIVSTIIKPEMSQLDKEKALHDYIVLNTKYDQENFLNDTVPKDSYTAYGALIKGIAVCEGYASGMDLLLKAVGIESKIVTGTANNGNFNGPHAWNLVNIDGTWYHLDTTWDDPVPDNPDKVIYSYFNLTEEEISKNHRIDLD